MKIFKPYAQYLFLFTLTFASFLAQANESDLDPLIQQAQMQPNPDPLPGTDPYEAFNRPVFQFNLAFHEYIASPISHAYLDYVPQPVQTGVSNFFNNLKMPLNALNHFLQGKGQAGLEGVMSFAINSVFGLGGLINIAKPAGLEPADNDFGKTLYKWGLWQESHYLVLPILGSYTTRSLVGSTLDPEINPIYYPDSELKQNKLPLTLGDKAESYAQATPFIDDLKNQADPYIFAREAFLQYRKNELYDGNPPVETLDDFDFE